jgi:hypothetical protein
MAAIAIYTSGALLAAVLVVIVVHLYAQWTIRNLDREAEVRADDS